MVIDFNRLGTIGTSPNTTARSGATPPSGNRDTTTASTQSAPPTEPQENVQLSPEAQQIQQIAEKLQKSPEVNEDKVAQLKAAIASGSYQVNAQRLAGKMISAAQDW